MRILILILFLAGSHCIQAQDSLQSYSGNGKFYGIFPLSEGKVVYSDTILFIQGPVRDSIYYKATAFFKQQEDAKYYFQSEDKELGEMTYQGKLKKSILSQKSDVHFTLYLHYTDSGCLFVLNEIVIASSKDEYSQAMPGPGIGGQLSAGGRVKLSTIERATDLENIAIDEDEFSKRYCEKMNQRLVAVMANLKSALR
jgi:hypothetical protein